MESGCRWFGHWYDRDGEARPDARARPRKGALEPFHPGLAPPASESAPYAYPAASDGAGHPLVTPAPNSRLSPADLRKRVAQFPGGPGASPGCRPGDQASISSTISSLSSALAAAQSSASQLSQQVSEAQSSASSVQDRLRASASSVQVVLSRSAVAAQSSASSIGVAASASVSGARASAEAAAQRGVADAQASAKAAQASADALTAEASRTKAEAESRVQQAKNSTVPVTRAAAGIVVAVIGTAILCFVGFWLFMRHKRSRRESQLDTAGGTAQMAEAGGSRQRMTSEEAKRGILEPATTRDASGSASNLSSRDGPQVAPAGEGTAAPTVTATPMPSRTVQSARASSPATATDGGLSTGVITATLPSTRHSKPPVSVGYASSELSSQGVTATRPSTANLPVVPGAADDRDTVSKAPFFQQRLGRVEEGRARAVTRCDIRQSWKSGTVSPIACDSAVDVASLPSASQALKRSRRDSGWPFATAGADNERSG